MQSYRDDIPQILRDFLAYHETIKAHSQKTVDEYYLDLRNFFRCLVQARDPGLRDKPLDEVSILNVDIAFIRSITLTEIYGYLTYLSRDRAQQQNSPKTGYGLSAATRARKIATLRSFFNYLTTKAHLLEQNPIKDLDSPKLRKTLPRYLTLDESVELLQSVDGANSERDYCILTLFLNCGLRISELIGLNLNDIQGDALRVLGKGDKVRIVYLNDACKDALERYLAVRRPISGRDENALFLSTQRRRMGVQAVENMVKKYARQVTPNKKITPHKLRSTYGTNLYRETGDIYLVADVLGHSDVNTTKKHYAALEDERRRSARNAVRLREDSPF